MALAALSVSLLACTAGAPPPTANPPPRQDAGPADASVPETALDTAPALPRCRPPAGMSGSPRTIDQMVSLINALPQPVTLTCVLEALDRPLRAFATSSVISLQPASGFRSPRIFLVVANDLVVSLVPAGMGSDALEFGQFVEPTRTLKAEIHFPVSPPLSRAAPYDRIRNMNGIRGTSCRFCHPDEVPAADIDYAEAFISGAFRPNWRTLVTVADVRAEREMCDAAAEPGRCAILGALFDHGPVEQHALPDTVPTIN
jgi:hypothetical protein